MVMTNSARMAFAYVGTGYVICMTANTGTAVRDEMSCALLWSMCYLRYFTCVCQLAGGASQEQRKVTHSSALRAYISRTIPAPARASRERHKVAHS